MRDKIAALLAKAEGTTNEHERDAFMAKAEDLMLKHGIEQAELESRGEAKPEEIIQSFISFQGSYSEIMGSFVNTVALAMGNLSVVQAKLRRCTVVYIIGHVTDVEHAEMIVRSLDAQARTAVKRWSRKQPNWGTGWERYVDRRSFVAAFASGAADRIRAERKVREGEASPGAELVLVSKQKRVDDWVADKYDLKQSSTRFRGGSGAGAGFAAGQQADVGTSRFEGQRKALS